MNTVATLSSSPFEPMAEQNTALAANSGGREIAEVQAAMVIAKKFPRDIRVALDRILQSCRRPTLAATALYSYSRGGTDVTGPSIRMAEAIARDWGNMQCGVRELEQRNGESTVEAFAWDLETNTRIVKVFQISHVRHKNEYVNGKKTGNTIAVKLTDPRDIYEMVANQGARRLRACILGVIPGDVVDAAVAECEQTLHASADTTESGIKLMVDAFAKIGVSKEQLEQRIQRRMDAITPAQVVHLRKIFTSIRDGMSKPNEWFEYATPEESNEAASRAQALADKIKEKQASSTSAPPQEAPVPETPIPRPASPNPDFPLSDDPPYEVDAATGEVITQGEQA